MSTDETPAGEIQINVKGPSELKLQITISPEKTVLELKHAIAAQSEVPADRQRLIYSGRVLKDDDALSVYKIQSAHTIHMVKGAARTGGDSSGAGAGSTPQQLPTMQAGQNPLDPLTQLNSHRGYGAMAGLNPFADMGLNPNDPNMMQTMMSSPGFMQQMSAMMSNPEVMEQIIASNPQMAHMAPQMRAAMQSPQFREIVANPERLQQMLQMASAFQSAGLGPGAGGAGGNPFAGTPNAFGGAFGGGSPPATGTAAAPAPGAPFNMFGGAPAPAAGTTPTAGTGTTPTAGAGGLPPFDPALMASMFGGAGAGGAWGGAAPAAPADTRSPEERFQVQLQQLQDMGFTNAAQNVRALLATAGNVHAAIEYILGGGGV